MEQFKVIVEHYPRTLRDAVQDFVLYRFDPANERSGRTGDVDIRSSADLAALIPAPVGMPRYSDLLDWWTAVPAGIRETTNRYYELQLEIIRCERHADPETMAVLRRQQERLVTGIAHSIATGDDSFDIAVTEAFLAGTAWLIYGRPRQRAGFRAARTAHFAFLGGEPCDQPHHLWMSSAHEQVTRMYWHAVKVTQVADYAVSERAPLLRRGPLSVWARGIHDLKPTTANKKPIRKQPA